MRGIEKSFKIKYSHGKIIEKEKNYLIYDVGSDGGSSGSPIILMKNLNVIGLHKGYLNNNSENKINIGIRIESIINKISDQIEIVKNKISYIKYTYEIKDNKYAQIINNRDEFEVNEEIESKIKILNGNNKEKLIFKKKFDKIGIHTVVFIIEEKLNNMSFMFNNCSSLKEIP